MIPLDFQYPSPPVNKQSPPTVTRTDGDPWIQLRFPSILDSGLTRLYDFNGFGARGANNCTFSTFHFSGPRTNSLIKSFKISGRRISHCIFRIFLILGTNRVQIGKFLNRGCLFSECEDYCISCWYCFFSKIVENVRLHLVIATSWLMALVSSNSSNEAS